MSQIAEVLDRYDLVPHGGADKTDTIQNAKVGEISETIRQAVRHDLNDSAWLNRNRPGDRPEPAHRYPLRTNRTALGIFSPSAWTTFRIRAKLALP